MMILYITSGSVSCWSTIVGSRIIQEFHIDDNHRTFFPVLRAYQKYNVPTEDESNFRWYFKFLQRFSMIMEIVKQDTDSNLPIIQLATDENFDTFVDVPKFDAEKRKRKIMCGPSSCKLFFFFLRKLL